ncbi:ATP-binding protein [Natronomonas sp. EA1]|uniref:PAS domain-containing sensor histidine kinase n=1 Tax=Natronomonas sp. EA1 TaxID=3421655 RepID=UPI003EBAA491
MTQTEPALDRLVRASLDSLPYEVAVVDSTGTIRYTNTAWRAFAETNDIAGDPTCVGVNYLEVCAATSVPTAAVVHAGLRAVLAGDSDELELEYPCHSPTQRRWFRMRVLPLESGGERFALVLHIDISAQKELGRDARAHSEALETVAAAVSYEIRDPIATALSHLALLRETAPEEHVVAIEAALARVQTIVTDTLRLARPPQIERLVATDVGAVARAAWANVETEGARLRTPEATVYADPGLLQRMLETLFENSVVHGGPEVAITVAVTPESLRVCDDGPGIPEVDRDRVFEPGFSTVGERAGFGLAIAKRIAAAHGWEIGIDSSETTGTCVVVTGVVS